MNISIVLPFLPKTPGGGIKVVYEYANYLALQGNYIQIYCLEGGVGTLNNYPILKNIRSLLLKIIVPVRKGIWFTFCNKVKFKVIKEICDNEINDADIVMATAVETAESVSRLNFSKGRKFYLIQDYENWYVDDEYVNYTYQLGLNNIVVSKWLKEIVDKYSNEPSFLLSNAIDSTVFKCECPANKREKYTLAFHYRSAVHKGSQYAIEAIRILNEKYKDLKVYVVSSGEIDVDLPKCCISFIGISPEKVSEINNKVQVFMCSSIEEGFGLPGLEAMACGAALVSTNYSGVREYAEDGVNSLLSPIKNADMLAENIIKLFEDEKLRNQIVLNGMKTAQSRTLLANGQTLMNLFLKK